MHIGIGPSRASALVVSVAILTALPALADTQGIWEAGEPLAIAR